MAVTEFATPDLSAPLDIDQRLKVAASHTVKGMFIQSVADKAKAVSGVTVGRGRWLPFKDYQFAEWLPVLAESAMLAYPSLPPREGMRRLGRTGYDTFASSMFGKVLLSVPGLDIHTALKLAPRMYSVVRPVGTCAVRDVEERRALVELRDIWDFPDSFQLGVFEGGMDVFVKGGSARTRVLSHCDVDIEISWPARPQPGATRGDGATGSADR